VKSLNLVERECGQCQACCQRFEISELAKPENQRCEHQCKQGCGIYPERPARCAAYRCRWLQGDPHLERRDRPDRLGVIFDSHSALGQLLEGLSYVVAHEVKPQALKSKRAARWIEALSRERLVIQVSFGGKRKVSGPPPALAEFERRVADSG